MKKLITIFVALIATFAVMAQGTFPVSPGYGSGVEATFRQRVIDSGGTSYPNIAPHIFSEQKSYGLLPVFQMIPAATKESVLFSQYPTDGTGDMTVANAGTKFVTNSDGLLERIAANIAAIDYTNGTPTLKLNEANTNLLEYPLSFGHSDWDKSGSTIEGDASGTATQIFNFPFTGSSLDNWNASNNWNIQSNAAAGAMTLTATAADQLCRRSDNTFEDGKVYRITYTASGVVGSPYFGGWDGSAHNLNDGAYNGSAIISDGTKSFDFVWNGSFTATSLRLYIVSSANLDNVVIDDIIISEVTGYPSPSVTYPTDAYKLVEDVSNGVHRIYTPEAVTSVGGTVTNYIYAKSGERNWIKLLEKGGGEAYYDLTNGVIGDNTSIGVSASIVSVSDSWYRCALTYTNNGVANDRLYVYLADADDSDSYTGDGTSGVYIAFAQLSEKSYAPTFTYSGTEGAQSSMLADVITGGGDAALFASVNASGVLYAEISAFTDGGYTSTISLSNNTDEWVKMKFNTTGVLFFEHSARGGATSYDYDLSSNTKIALSWKDGVVELYINGVNVASATYSVDAVGFDIFNFSEPDGSTNPFYGNAKQVAVYNYLTDAQMVELTTP